MFHYGGSSIVFFTKDLYIMVHEYFLLFRNLIFFEGLNNMYSSYKNYLLIHSLVMLDILRFNQNWIFNKEPELNYVFNVCWDQVDELPVSRYFRTPENKHMIHLD